MVQMGGVIKTLRAQGFTMLHGHMSPELLSSQELTKHAGPLKNMMKINKNQHSYRKSPFLMGNPTIPMVMLNSYVSHYQTVLSPPLATGVPLVSRSFFPIVIGAP